MHAKHRKNGGHKMKKINMENPIFLFIASALLTGIIYGGLSFFDKMSYIYTFFYRCWYIQGISTGLFCVSILFVVFKFYHLKHEDFVLSTKVLVERFNSTLLPHTAKNILEKIPEKYKDAISFRRISEILRGYLYGEEVIRLNQELSRRDVEQIEGGHLIINAMKQLIPVLGFLGTVVGLSIGIAKFPALSNSAGDIESLRSTLKGFAASLSVAFDTTLLALGYTVILVLIASFLRRREEAFVSELDDKVRHLITKLSHTVDSTGKQEIKIEGIIERFANNMKGFMEQLASKNGNYGKEVVDVLRQNGDAFLRKMDELKDNLQKPPRYEIIVQPIEGK